jgi:hypothetical protein
MIQTLALPGASPEGLLTKEALQAQALSQTAEVFGKTWAYPALYVYDLTVEDSTGAKPGPGQPAARAKADQTSRPGVSLMTMAIKSASALRYLHLIGFLVKRPGNPFPQFVSLGRAPNNDIVFSEDSISKFHGYFTGQQGQWAVTDFRSTNGSELNGKRLAPAVATPIKNGDRIRFGGLVCVEFLEPASLYAKLRA